MLSIQAVVQLALAASLPLASTSSIPPNDSIAWFACEQNATLPVTCGALAVPLDYTNVPSMQTINLSLVKFNATKSPVKGSILFNPGGPGLSPAREFVAATAELLLDATGGYYDLIGFDTRGTGNILPFSCFKDALSRQNLAALASQSPNASDISLGTAWAVQEVLAENCYENARDVGELLGTAFVARDMMQIVDALDEDGMLRYWGFSYGTVLGATVAAMFPDRMDKIVLDGVSNSHEWYAGWVVEGPIQADQAFERWLEACFEIPENCSLSQQGATAQEVLAKTQNLLDTIKYNPIVLGSNITTDIVQYTFVKTLIATALKAPLSYLTILPDYLNALMNRNTTAYRAALAQATDLLSTAPLYPDYGPESLYGIQCADTALRVDNVSQLLPLIQETYNSSSILGDAVAGLCLLCSGWKMTAKERYTGSFNVKTKNPILFIGGTLDPVTPLISARNMSVGFEGSVVLEHNGFGHCSISHPSSCTFAAVAGYFTNGTLPQEGTVCEPDLALFESIPVS